MRKKGQSSLEFVMLVGFVLLSTGMFLVVIQNNLISAQDAQNQEMVDQVIHVLESEILYAEQSGVGYTRNMFLPTNLGGLDYNISSYAEGREIVVTFKEKKYVYFRTENSSRILGNLRVGSSNMSRICPTFQTCAVFIS